MSDDVAVADVDESVDSTPDTSTPETSVASEPASSASPQASAAPQQSVWDAFKNLDEFRGQDDIAIARRLYASMEREKAATNALAQYQQYVPIAQQYLQNREPFEQFQQHRESFQRWLASQQQPAAQQVEKTSASEAMKKWWNPPEVRDSYRQYLVKDENGREVISPDAPLDAKHALYEYQKYKADFAQKFLTNPEEALGPMIQEIAQRQAQQIVESQFAEVHQQQYVSGLEQENRDWLYDQSGRPTEEGLAAQRYIDEAASMGIQGAEMRWAYATKMIERDLLERLRTMGAEQTQRSAFEAGLPQQMHAAAMQQQAPAAPLSQPASAPSKAERDIEFLRREASRSPSKAAGNDDPRTPQAPLTFEQRLARQLARDGITS
jgi:hypothetical protein